MRAVSVRAWLLVVLLGWAAPAVLAAGPQGAEKPDGEQSARQRWEAMTPQEQALMRDRFEALKGMQEGRRRELRERHDRWRETERRTLARLPRSTREQLDGLDPHKRREVLKELVEEDLAARGRDLREHLPSEWRQRIESARPEDRRRVLDEFTRGQRAMGQRGVLDRAARDLGLGEAERAEIEALPEREREPRLLSLHARAVRNKVQRDGLPSWISQAEWAELSALEPRAFLEELHARRREAGELAGPGGRRGPRSGGAEGQAGPGGPGGTGGPGSTGGRAPQETRTPGLPGALGRPDPAWRVELSQLSPEERRVAVEARVRERVLNYLAEHPEAVTPEQRTQLEAAEGREFFDLLRSARMRGPAQRPGGEGGPGAGERGPGRGPRSAPGGGSRREAGGEATRERGKGPRRGDDGASPGAGEPLRGPRGPRGPRE